MTFAATAVAALLVAGGAIALVRGPGDDGSSLVVGYYTPDDQLPLANLTIVDGAYNVRYSAEVRFFSRQPGTVLRCGLVDTSGRISYLPQSVSEAPGNGTWTTIAHDEAFELPGLTLGIRCAPSTAGPIGLAYRDVALTAEPLG